mgnify:CR=1 FL=1
MISPTLFRTFHRSIFVCMFIQPSGVTLVACAMLTAISGLSDNFSLANSDKVFRVIPKISCNFGNSNSNLEKDGQNDLSYLLELSSFLVFATIVVSKVASIHSDIHASWQSLGKGKCGTKIEETIRTSKFVRNQCTN